MTFVFATPHFLLNLLYHSSHVGIPGIISSFQQLIVIVISLVFSFKINVFFILILAHNIMIKRVKI